MQSILDNNDTPIIHIEAEELGKLLKEPEEFELIKKIAEREQCVLEAKNGLAPHNICRHLLETAKEVNTYYANVKILKSEDSTKSARLLLIQKTLETMKK